MLAHSRRPLLIIIAGLALVAAAVTWGRWRAADPGPQPPTAEVLSRRAALLEELTPVTLSNCRFERVGSPNDGGYAMCGNLMDGVVTAYSYGIGGNDDWGCQLSTRLKVPVHQYDCFEPESEPCPGGDQRKNRECVGARQEMQDGRSFDTLVNQIARNGDSALTKVVKMDIEGGEWPALLAAPDDFFASIAQMPMELHGIDEPEVLEGIRRLKKHFYLVAVHFNNWNCSDTWAPFPNFAYQVLLVNKKLGVIGPPEPGWPTLASVLAPDNRRAPECVVPAPLVPGGA